MSPSRYRLLAYIIIVVLLLLAGAFVYLKGDEEGSTAMRITTATPDQIANDMQQDDFYSNYRERTLMIQATVASITDENGDTVIQLQTTSAYSAYCDIGSALFTGKQGDAITILAEGGPAERQAAAVSLKDCVVLSDGTAQ